MQHRSDQLGCQTGSEVSEAGVTSVDRTSIIIGNILCLCAMITDSNRGLLGWLPIIANFEYSVAVFKLRDNERALKLAFIVNMVLFAVFSAVIMNFVGVLSCSVITVTTAVSLVKGLKEETDRKS